MTLKVNQENMQNMSPIGFKHLCDGYVTKRILNYIKI